MESVSDLPRLRRAFSCALRTKTAVDHEGEVLDAVVTSKRDKAAALKLLKRILKKYGRPRKIVTDGLCSYSAAMKEVGACPPRRSCGRRST
jgi:putative transposase